MRLWYFLAPLILFLSACGPQVGPRQNSHLANTDSHEDRVVSLYHPETQETEYKLEPIGDNRFKREELNRIEREMRALREQKSITELKKISEGKTSEIIKFQNLSYNSAGLEPYIRLTILENGESYPSVFQQDRKEGSVTYFKKASGFSKKPVAVRSYCVFQDKKGDCKKIVIEVAYRIHTTKVVQQFDFQLSTELEVEEQEKALPGKGSAPSKQSDEDPLSDQAPDEKPPVSESFDAPQSPSAAAPIQTTVRPKARPSHLASSTTDEKEKEPSKDPSIESQSPYAPKKSLRPKLRPNDLKTEIEEDGESMSVGGGLYILPEDKKDGLGDTSQTHFVDTGETLKGGYKSINAEVTQGNKILEQIQTTVFMQAKGYNSRGWLQSANQLPKHRDYDVGPNYRRVEQYGSTLTTKVLEYAFVRHKSRFKESLSCINDLSKKEGGYISGHSSHQNGLDADVSYPSSYKCNNGGKRFQLWNDIRKADPKFLERNYDFLKSLEATKRIAIIFTDLHFARTLCQWTKSQNFNSQQKSERKKIFRLLNDERGHANHYHIRMKCNYQNEGCRDHDSYSSIPCS